jgi:hypothetical protein
MKKLSVVLAALVTLAVASPTIASAMEKPMTHKGMHHHKMMMHHHKMMHRHKMMMKKHM